MKWQGCRSNQPTRDVYHLPWSRRRRVCSVIAVFFVFFLPTALLAADRVIPNDRVTTSLNVREQASVNSPVVGQLPRDASAELIRSIPYWYEIRLENGTTGYVSKAWSETIASATDAGKVIRLGTWNLKKLGHGDNKDYALIARMIESHFDILAVVEVMQKQQAHSGYEVLMAALGTGWSGQVTDTPRPNTTSGNAEYYAIVYRNAAVEPCQGWTGLRYFPDNDGSAQGSGPDTFSREPAYGCYQAPVNDTTIGVDFLLAAYHAVAQGNAGVAGVKAEVSGLTNVFQTMAVARPGEKDLFIAGDFNVTPAQLASVIPHGDRTEGSGSTLNSQGGISANLFDHLLVKDEVASQELIGNAEVLDVRGDAANDASFFQTVSDHLPIEVRLRASGPDDD